MDNQEHPLPPCPERGGPRAWFRVERESMCLYAGWGKFAQLYACTCLGCGATTLRPPPHQMEEIREWARTQKPFRF